MSSPKPEITYKPSVWVREIKTQDGSALLDIQHGLCLGLNPVGAEIWQAIKHGLHPDEIAARIASQFQKQIGQVYEDVRNCVDDLSGKGLLVPLHDSNQLSLSRFHNWRIKLAMLSLRRSTNGKRATRFLVAKSLVALAMFDSLGFSTDFAQMLEFVRSWPLATDSRGLVTVEPVCAAVNYACVWYPKRVLCLQRSAITTCLLRSCGIEAHMVLGAQKVPFRAHAWTEVEGRPVNERRDVRAAYLVWDRC